MRSRISYIVLAILLASLVVAAIPAAAEDEVKITVLQTYDLTELSGYMYNSTSAKLETVDTSKVQILSDSLKDLASDDDVQPAILLSIDVPTTDLNTNESIAYSYMLINAYGVVVVGVADVNSTTNEVSNLQLVKISPVSGDVGVVRTNSDIVVEYSGSKLSIDLSSYSNPKVLLMTDDELSLSQVQYVELRAVEYPPSGYVLVKEGSGEALFTISANGEVSIWFDEEHDAGDVDLFIYDSSDTDYSNADITQTWAWHRSHCTQYIYADAYPQIKVVTASGSLKFVVKKYRGDAGQVRWRVAARITSSPSPSPSPTQTTTTTTTPTPGGEESEEVSWQELIARLQLATQGQDMWIAAIIIVFIVLILIVLLKRR